jgi:hypothetical protein
MIGLALLLLQGAASPSCAAPPEAPALDHAVIVVADLEAATRAFGRAGFRVKPGRLHANGLLNNHVKFRDGTEIELMTVRGLAADDMARRYASLMAGGDRGVYVALRARSTTEVAHHAAALGLRTTRSSSGAWQFLSLDESRGAATVFFTSGGGTAADADSVFQHEPPVSRLHEVWTEGGPELEELMLRLGATRCEGEPAPDGRPGKRFALRNGNLVVVPLQSDLRARVLGVVLESPGSGARRSAPVEQFWIHQR